MAKNKMRILIEVDGIQTPILFYRWDNDKKESTLVDDPQLTHHMNNIDDAIRTAIYNIPDFEVDDS